MLNATHAAAKHHVQATRSFVHLYTNLKLKVTKLGLAREPKAEMRIGIVDGWNSQGLFLSRWGTAGLFLAWGPF